MGNKVIKSFSYSGDISYSLVQTLLL